MQADGKDQDYNTVYHTPKAHTVQFFKYKISGFHVY